MTLSELAFQARIVGKIGLLGVVLLGGFIIFFVFLLNSLKPAPQLTSNINTIFGKLDEPQFEEAQEKVKLQFFLDTVDGELPVATKEASVFRIPDKQSTIAYLNKIYAIALRFGFDTQVIKHEPINQTWVKFENEKQILTIDIRTFHYNFRLKGSEELQQLINATPEAKFTALEGEILDKAKEIYRTHESYSEDLASGKTNIVYVKYDVTNQAYYPITSEETPQAVRVDFFRKDEGAFPVVPPKYYESHNYEILAPLTRDVKMVAIQNKSFEKQYTQVGIYPIKSVQTAWGDLQKNRASIIALETGFTGTIKIKQMYVAYYDPQEYQQYFEPIYVFLGDHGYVSYLPAIPDRFLVGYSDSKSR